MICSALSTYSSIIFGSSSCRNTLIFCGHVKEYDTLWNGCRSYCKIDLIQFSNLLFEAGLQFGFFIIRHRIVVFSFAIDK